MSSEAASLAGHLGLAKLICLYDDNDISIEGTTGIAFTENVAKRFDAYRWQVIRVKDGSDPDAIEQAILAAKAETGSPSIIMLKTHIAYGSPNKQDTADAHGAPLGEEEIVLTKAALGWKEKKPFAIPKKALTAFRKCVKAGEKAEARWKKAYQTYNRKHPRSGRRMGQRPDPLHAQGLGSEPAPVQAGKTAPWPPVPPRARCSMPLRPFSPA